MTTSNPSPLLIPEPPLQVLPSLAEKIGLNEAIALQQVHYWLRNFQKSESKVPPEKRRHFKRNRWWVYNTYAEWQETNFPFWSETTIKRTFLSLERQGLLIADQLSADRHDRTKWYTIDYEELNRLCGESSEEIELHSGQDTGGMSPKEVEPMTPSIGSKWPDGAIQDEPVSTGQDGPMIKGSTETTAETTSEMDRDAGVDTPDPSPPRRKSDPLLETPEIQRFQAVTGRYPLKDQRKLVIEFLQLHPEFTPEYLTPFWETWVGRDHKRTNLDWLFDWAAKGQVARPGSAKKASADPGRATIEAIQRVIREK